MREIFLGPWYSYTPLRHYILVQYLVCFTPMQVMLGTIWTLVSLDILFCKLSFTTTKYSLGDQETGRSASRSQRHGGRPTSTRSSSTPAPPQRTPSAPKGILCTASNFAP